LSGVGQEKPTYEALRKAFEAHAQEVYGEGYVLQDFIAIGYVVSLEDITDDDRAEYVLATSSKADHIITGLTHQVALFGSDDAPED
jgi:hypothetical protein